MKKPRENLLRRIASKSDHRTQKHAAIILKGSRLISAGYNHGEMHAEISAISKIRHKIPLDGCTIISFRVTKSGEIGLSRPCIDCFFKLKVFGFRNVIYSDGKKWMEIQI